MAAGSPAQRCAFAAAFIAKYRADCPANQKKHIEKPEPCRISPTWLRRYASAIFIAQPCMPPFIPIAVLRCKRDHRNAPLAAIRQRFLREKKVFFRSTVFRFFPKKSLEFWTSCVIIYCYSHSGRFQRTHMNLPACISSSVGSLEKHSLPGSNLSECSKCSPQRIVEKHEVYSDTRN